METKPWIGHNNNNNNNNKLLKINQKMSVHKLFVLLFADWVRWAAASYFMLIKDFQTESW